MDINNIKGSITALITPFDEGNIDADAYEKLIEWQIKQGTQGLVPTGTTGESPTLDHEEHNRIIEICVKTSAGRVPVIAGTGSNSTAEAIMTTRHAEKIGADVALIIAPYYNKPTQEGLFQHFKAIHDASEIPIIIYNVPGRTVVDIEDETTLRIIDDLPRVIGIKDATGDLKRPEHIAKLASRDFMQLSGEDDTVVEFYEKGGAGCISVTSNIAPALCAKMHKALEGKNITQAAKIQDQLLPLHNVMFCETSPGPVKYAASLLGICKPELRLPMVMPTNTHQQQIKIAMKNLDLI